MLRVIRQILSPEGVTTLKAAANGTFAVGMTSAGFLVADQTNNEELALGQNQRDKIVRMVQQRLWRNKQLQIIVRPRRILPPIVSRYPSGMRYSDHMDNVIIGGSQPFQVYCSITIFLDDPASYGGKLVINTTPGEQRLKLEPGDAVIYPTQYVHRVEEGISGERLACVTWMESLVRDLGQREVLYDLAIAAEHIHKLDTRGEAFMTLEKARFNLLRMWAEI